MNLLDYLKVFPNAIPKQTSGLLLSYRDNPRTSTTIKEIDKERINSEYRKTESIHLPEDVKTYIHTAISNFSNHHLKKYYHHDVKNIETPQLLYYNVGGKYDVHNDSEDYINGKLTRMINRDITFLAYLNDDYEGGELEFPDYGITIKPKENTIITFPSYIDFDHRVIPVTKGERYCIVSWIETKERIYERPY